ncbi:MAG: T9SS type A sorting domain-containing protein, partial [Bacteroidales bacterium]|nr:T9SS type A sorting domain-containing protein [Bacteroidales bacterium]
GESTTDDFWIEGIGSINHAIEPFTITSEKSYCGLNYKKENGEIVYHSTETWFTENDCGTVRVENNLEKSENILYQNSPNPFSKKTTIQYKLSEKTTNAKICIYDLNGKELRSFTLNTAKGTSSVEVNASDLLAGIYLYSLIADNKLIATKRMILTE